MLKEIKHSFMVYRNGIVADTLRAAGMPYAVIFGLQLPQLNEIARSQQPSAALARELWADRRVRESRLLAPMLFPADELQPDEALSMACDVQTREEADILCFKLLRRLPYAAGLLPDLIEASGRLSAADSPEAPLAAYCAEALKRNLAD
jgi:hypothetical protein